MLKILFADDSMTAQNMGKKILADAGYEVIAVSNGAAAAKKLLEHQPDMAILDVHMPGYSGFEVCAKIRAVPAIAKMPVLLTVGKMEPYSVEEGARVKADGVIIKPFEASVLLATVRNLCERAQANRAGQEEFEATMRIEPPKFEEFKDDSYNTWKSETQDAEGTAERAVAEEHMAPAAMGASQEAASAPAYAFDQTISMRPASDPAFAETLPFLAPSRHVPDFPSMTGEPHFPPPSAEPVHAFDETLPSFPSLLPTAKALPVTQEQVAPLTPSFDDTVPAWPNANQAAVQAAAHAAFLTEEPPAYSEDVAEEYIETARIEPALQADKEDALRDTQKIVPQVAKQEAAATLETFEPSTSPVSAEPPAGFEPTILAKTQDPVITRDPSLETPLQEIGSPEVQAGSEPGLLGNAMEEPTAPGFATAAFSQASSPEELRMPAKRVPAPEPTFSRPQDIAFDKMVSDLLEREPVPLPSNSAEPNTISTAAIPIPEQPAGFFSKYVALGRAEEEQPVSAAPTVEPTRELTQETGAQVAVPSGQEQAPEAALQEVEAPEPSAAAAAPEANADASLNSAFYAPTMEYSYPEDRALYPEHEEPVEHGLASVEGAPAVADPELVAQLAAAFEHIEAAPQPHEQRATRVSHETATVTSASPASLDVETVSQIITRVLDRVMPEIVRMIASELEAEKNYRLQ